MKFLGSYQIFYYSTFNAFEIYISYGFEDKLLLRLPTLTGYLFGEVFLEIGLLSLLSKFDKLDSLVNNRVPYIESNC